MTIHQQQPSNKISKSAIHTLQLIGTITAMLLFIFLLSKLDWSAAIVYIQSIPAYTIPLALGLFLIGQWLNSLRWYYLLRAQKTEITPWRSFQVSMCGAFASNFLPSTIGGDSLRFAFVSLHTNQPAMALASVVFDRILNFISTLTFLPFAFVFLPLNIDTQVSISITFTQFPEKIRVWLMQAYSKTAEVIKPWRNQPKEILKAFTFAWLGSFVVMIGVWVVAKGLSIPVTLSQVFGVSSVAYFVSLIPISISGFGIREVTVTTMYMLLGAGAEQATALALINRILSTGETLLGAIWIRSLLMELSVTERNTRD